MNRKKDGFEKTVDSNDDSTYSARYLLLGQQYYHYPAMGRHADE